MAAAFQPPAFAHPATHGSAPMAAPAAPAGTFVPGTKVQVGSHRVVIEKYLSEGGFAHVYLVRLPKAIEGDETAVLKRVAVPDKEALASMRIEVETMKKLKGHRYIVTYIDSHASQLKGGGYEVFLLMEYCNGGGLIDFMNTRLQNRLTESEVLHIFSDVAQGVACMHYLKPPLLHRDLKVENVLIRTSGSSSRRYKLCDFGSTAPPRPAATSAAEGRLIEDDVQKNTTLQYRSPEMIDVYRKQPIDEKSDIWALGVLLYKLCYYKTPFEEQGQMAILNASFKYPGYPAFSDRIKKLIASLLRENPQQRPNIYQVIKEVSSMRGTDIPLKDIYAGRSHSEARRNQHLPSPNPEMQTTPPLVAGAFKAPVVVEKRSIPDIVPMRRGRPTTLDAKANAPKPSPSPLRNSSSDPFSVLDAGKPSTRDSTNFDEIAARFPALDDFSLLHDSGGKFAFDSKSAPAKKQPQDLKQQVTNALADDAFAFPSTSVKTFPSQPPSTQSATENSKNASNVRKRPSSLETKTTLASTIQPKPSSYVSTGTMTSNPPSPTVNARATSNRQIFRFPPQKDEKPLPEQRTSDPTELAAARLRADATSGRLSHADSQSKPQQEWGAEHSLSSRPSFEISHRSSFLGGFDNSLHRSRSATTKSSRPSSMNGPSKPGIFRRLSREKSREPRTEDQVQETDALASNVTGNAEDSEEAGKIDSSVDYLKALEEAEAAKKKEKRLSSGSRHFKRTSMPSVSLTGTKNLLAGRFGEAFRRYETNSEDPSHGDESRQPIHLGDDMPLSPIVGSEATDGRSDDGNSLEESEEVPPEIRRELERRRLEQEEKRVTDAAAAYRQQRLTNDGKGGSAPRPNQKAMSIQSKVRSLLDESGRASPSPTRTAEGYGKYTDRGPSPAPNNNPPQKSSRQAPAGASLPNGAGQTPSRANLPPPHAPVSLASRLESDAQQLGSVSMNNPMELPRHSAPPSENPVTRPPGPPKPQPKPPALRTADRAPASPLKPSALTGRKSFSTRNPYQTSPPEQSDQTTPTPGKSQIDGAVPDEDWENSFSKRYPDLSGLGLVETDIDDRLYGRANKTGGGGPGGLGRETRIRDV